MSATLQTVLYNFTNAPRYTAVQIKNWSKSMSVITVATMKNTMVPWHLCNKSRHYEKYERFLVTQRTPSRATTKLMLLTVTKDEWRTKEGTGKSLKNALHILQCAKGTSWAEAMSNSEKIKPVALVVIELH